MRRTKRAQDLARGENEPKQKESQQKKFHYDENHHKKEKGCKIEIDGK